MKLPYISGVNKRMPDLVLEKLAAPSHLNSRMSVSVVNHQPCHSQRQPVCIHLAHRQVQVKGMARRIVNKLAGEPRLAVGAARVNRVQSAKNRIERSNDRKEKVLASAHEQRNFLHAACYIT